MELKELSARYEEAREGKARADEALKAANATLERAMQDLADAMIDGELSSFRTDDASYSLAVRDYYRAAAGKGEELMDALIDNGMGDLIKMSVNANTLSAAMREMAEENDGALPAEYDGLVSVYSRVSISRRAK